MNYDELANLIFPDVLDSSVYEAKYPKRKLKEGAMVTRFAPSPTGFVHMGSLYTSFADIRLARQTGGVVYLRIEDTDQKREIEDGITGIIHDFDNLKIYFDEGPTQGGDYGPYIQSKRKEIYQSFAKKLLKEGKAYPCFITEEELKEIKEVQEKKKVRIGFYGRWAKYRDLKVEEAIAKIKAGVPYIIRLKSPGNFENKVVLDDCIKGKIEMPENDMDVVIIKSDGLPTYHFAHAIDDHLMRTTHVVRGDEWVSSYPIHKQLFEVLGFEVPKYAHIAPLTIREGNTVRKLSKRKDKESAISFYHKLGVPNEVINLYIATVNNSNFEEWYVANPDKTIDDYEFTFDKMPVGGSLFDLEKLQSISKIYFSKLTAVDIYNRTLEYAKQYDMEFYDLIKDDKDYLVALLNIERNVERPRMDIGSYSDVKEQFWYMYDELFNKVEDPYKEVSYPYDVSFIKDYFINVYREEDTEEDWFNKVKEYAKDKGFAINRKEYKENPSNFLGNIADFCSIIRVMLTTSNTSPNMYDLLKIYGKDKLLKRVDLFLDSINK